MNIKEQITADRLTARKAHDEARTGTLGYLLGQIELGEKQPNAKPDLALSIVQSYKKSMLDNIGLVGASSDHGKGYLRELEIIKPYLPADVSMDEVDAYIVQQLASGVNNKGLLMKAVKAQFGAGVDMKAAGAAVDAALAKPE